MSSTIYFLGHRHSGNKKLERLLHKNSSSGVTKFKTIASIILVILCCAA
jgi:hypothetical protein